MSDPIPSGVSGTGLLFNQSALGIEQGGTVANGKVQYG